MNINHEAIDELNAVLKVKVVAEDYLPKVETALKEAQRKHSAPGFRPGKTPVGLIKKMYGKAIVSDEVYKVLNDSMQNYIKDNQIELIGQPIPNEKSARIMDWENQKEFEFMFDMGLVPKFDVELSPKTKFEYQTIKIDDEFLNTYISDVAKRYGKVEQAEIAQDGDLLYGDFVELDANGEILAGGIFKTGSLFMDKIKDGAAKKSLTGIKKDDKVVLDTAQLRESNVDLAVVLSIDKAVAETLMTKLQFTLKGITRMLPAEINQELFDKIFGPGDVTSEEEFRLRFKTELAGMFVNDSETKFYNDVVQYLMDNVKVNLPDEFLKRWILVADDKITPTDVETDYVKYANGVKWQLIEGKLIKDNNLSVTQEELVDFTKMLINEQYRQYSPNPISDEEMDKSLKTVLSNNEEVKKIAERIFEGKMKDLFKSKYTLENKEVSYTDFFNVKK